MSALCQKRTSRLFVLPPDWDLFRIGGVKTVDKAAPLKFVDER
jgi:hypothetical protein